LSGLREPHDLLEARLDFRVAEDVARVAVAEKLAQVRNDLVAIRVFGSTGSGQAVGGWAVGISWLTAAPVESARWR